MLGCSLVACCWQGVLLQVRHLFVGSRIFGVCLCGLDTWVGCCDALIARIMALAVCAYSGCRSGGRDREFLAVGR